MSECTAGLTISEAQANRGNGGIASAAGVCHRWESSQPKNIVSNITEAEVETMKWLLQNLQNRSVFAAKNPRYTARVLLAEMAQTDEKFLALVTGASVKQIRSYFDEPITTPAFARHFQEEAESSANLNHGFRSLCKERPVAIRSGEGIEAGYGCGDRHCERRFVLLFAAGFAQE